MVVENFHRCREELEKEERAARALKKAKKIEERRKRELMTSIKTEYQIPELLHKGMMERPYYIDFGAYRLVTHKLVKFFTTTFWADFILIHVEGNIKIF